MDDIDYVFLAGEESKLLVDCSDCPHYGYTIGDSIERYAGRYSNTYCSNAKSIIHDLDIPIASLPQKNKRPYVPIPEWCPLRKVVLTEIPITIRSMNTIDYIISELFTIGRYAAIRPLKRGLNLVIVGELTSDVKEILVEILI